MRLQIAKTRRFDPRRMVRAAIRITSMEEREAEVARGSAVIAPGRGTTITGSARWLNRYDDISTTFGRPGRASNVLGTVDDIKWCRRIGRREAIESSPSTPSLLGRRWPNVDGIEATRPIVETRRPPRVIA